jgi:hypothetical protein
MKGEKAFDWKDFHKFSLAKGNQLKDGSSERLLGAREFFIYWVCEVLYVL